MPKYKYVCEGCGNEVPAERVERRVPGSKGHVRVNADVDCEACDREMLVVAYEPPRREVRDESGR